MTALPKCALCGTDIQGHKPIVKKIDGQEIAFCSEGCARIYQVAHDNHMLDEVLSEPKQRGPSLRDALIDRGKTAHFAVSGMECAGCASTIERVLRKQAGIKDVSVSLAAEQGRIQYDPAVADPKAVLATLDRLGYHARLLTDEAQEKEDTRQERLLLQLVTAAAFGMQVMLLYLTQLYHLYAAGQFNTPDVRHLQYLTWGLATPALIAGGWSFFRGALGALTARTANMDTLVSLGLLSAYSYSVYVTLTGAGEAYFDSVVMITTFVLLGRYLEKVGGAQARKDIRGLLKLQPEKAWLWQGDTWQEVSAAKLGAGDKILVKAGQRVPVDARVVEGEGAADESLLTGESAPVNKGTGDLIYAGTLIAESALQAEVVRPMSETRLAQITQLVEQTLSTKPPIQRLADRASTYFALGILGAALVTGVAWAILGRAAALAVLPAVAVLVVACPCALGLATPLAMAVALGQATRAGILVRNAAALEMAAKTGRVVFDKTGTLTQGHMSVVETRVAPEGGQTEAALLQVAAAVEQYSEHPIARAVLAASKGTLPSARGFQMLRGLGASAEVERSTGIKRVLVGSAGFLGIDERSPLWQEAQQAAERGETVVWAGWDGQVMGYIALRDEPNATAPVALQRLEAQGISCVMLSGDSPAATKAVAEELGLSDYEGNCPPPLKADRVKSWQQGKAGVAMVGDGVNDAPALAQADLSITVAGGADVAGETSDIVLTRSDLGLIPLLIDLSRRTRRIITQNLGWAFAYNIVTVPLAAAGYIRPVIAAATMATSSLLVVGNSLRLRR